MQDLALGIILFGTITGLYLRPFGTRDWQVALVGAVAAWVVGPLGFRGRIDADWDSANVVAFFGLMLIAAGAEAAGLYERAAMLLRAQGSTRALVGTVIVLGTLITAVLSNDATPLVLTPAVFAAGRLGERSTRDGALAATIVADGASLLLPVSNPVNLLFFERFDMGFGQYLSTITPAALAGVAITGLVLYKRAESRESHAVPEEVASPGGRDIRPALVAVLVLAVAYVVAGIAAFPLGLVTLGGGVAIFLGARAAGPVELKRYRRHLAPGVLVFVSSLLLLVSSIDRAGLLGSATDLLETLADVPLPITIFGAAILAAVLANLVNNWPAALLLATAIASTAGPHEGLVAGALIGTALGANFTMVGSLSTVFWLSLARQAGAEFSPTEYARRAFVPTIAGVVAACAVASLVA